MRNKSFTYDTSVEIYLDEIMEEITDDELREELRSRSGSDTTDLIEEAYEALGHDDIAVARLRLEQFLFPKFKSVKACREKYEESRK